MMRMDKIKAEYKALKNLQDGKPKDWLKAPWNTHHWTDMFTESCRHAEYLMGHVWAIYFPASIIVMVFLYTQSS